MIYQIKSYTEVESLFSDSEADPYFVSDILGKKMIESYDDVLGY